MHGGGVGLQRQNIPLEEYEYRNIEISARPYIESVSGTNRWCHILSKLVFGMAGSHDSRSLCSRVRRLELGHSAKVRSGPDNYLGVALHGEACNPIRRIVCGIFIFIKINPLLLYYPRDHLRVTQVSSFPARLLAKSSILAPIFMNETPALPKSPLEQLKRSLQVKIQQRQYKLVELANYIQTPHDSLSGYSPSLVPVLMHVILQVETLGRRQIHAPDPPSARLDNFHHSLYLALLSWGVHHDETRG